MATAAPSPLVSSVEKTNGNKLSRLLIDGGTTVLRMVFDHFHPPVNLASNLNTKYSILKNLLRKRILNGQQWVKLFPPGGAAPNSNTFDITLLFLLLTNICGLFPPLTGWHTKPSPSDNSCEANLARIKFFRNELYGHVTSTGVDATTFSSLWQEISTALHSLGLDQAEIDRLKAEHGGEQDYLDALIEWADSEEDIKTQLKDIRQSQIMAEKTMKEVRQTQLKLDETLKSGTLKVEKLSLAQCKTEDIAENLMKMELKGQQVLHDNKSKLDEVSQLAYATHQATKEAHQESISRLDGVCECQSKTNQAVGEIRRSVQEVKQEVQSLTKRRNEQPDEVLKTLVKSEFKGDIEYHTKKFQEGTREWIFKSIEDWLDDRSSSHRVMVISGNAGMGKTVVSAVVAQRMQKAGRLSGSHFCQHNNSRYRDPRLMLQSLACHLSHAMPDYKNALVKQLSRNLGIDLNNMGVEELFSLLFKEPLNTVHNPGKNTLIVIDGLDESEYQGRNELLHVIRNHFSMLPVWIRILITTRPERNITGALRNLEPIELEQKQEENLNDIQTLFEKQLSHKIGEEHKHVLLKELVKKSEGLFIYAHFIVDFIQNNVPFLTPDQLESVLPSGISSVYLSYFQRLEEELYKEPYKELHVDEENFLRFLCALTASREPLPVEFIAKILNQEGNLLTAHRRVNKANAFVSTLLPVHEGRLHFFHKSIKDWLIASSPYERHDFTVDEKEGHGVLSDLCASELDSVKRKGVHGKQFTSTKKYALHHAIQHMLETNDHERADSSGTSGRTAHRVYQYVTDLELTYAKLCVNSTSATEDLFCIRHQHRDLLDEQGYLMVTSMFNLLRKHSYILLDHPHLFFQCLINEGTPELSSTAASILESSIPKIPYMKYLDREEKNGADQARFYCSDKIACFDVSPELDYLVCECRDETIHLWSLQTGIRLWVRPSPTKREYHSRVVYESGAYRLIGHFLSFYHSVIFHPNGKSVLPGTLRYVYTISGDREDLFPHSNCTFSYCVLRSFTDGNVLFTDCPADPKQIILWDMENGQNLGAIDFDEEISSFAISDDGSLIAISDVTRTITLIDVRIQPRLKMSLGNDDFNSLCGLMHFTSDNNTLVCGFLYWQCDEARCPLEEERKPKFTFITPVKNVSLSDPHFEPLKLGTFVLWPSVPSGTLAECDFMEQNEGPCWVSKVQKEIPYLFSGSYTSLNDETLLVSSPDHKFVTMFNVDLLKSESGSTYTSNVNVKVRKIFTSMEGDAIYAISSREFVLSSGEVIVTVWRMSSREFLKTKAISGPVSIAPTKAGLVLFKDDRVAELWNFELSECIRYIVKITSDTSILYGVTMMPVSDTMIAFFYLQNSFESIYIRRPQESEENEESLDDFLPWLVFEDCNTYRLDFIDTASVGGKLVSSQRFTADAKEYIDYISCSSPSKVLVCNTEDKSTGPVHEEKVTVSLFNNRSIKWERITEYFNSGVQDAHMIFSPKYKFVVTWNTLNEGRGLHILNADTGGTLHVFLGDQKDIVDCKFVDDESLVCCSRDNCLRLYNVRTGDLLSVLDIGEQPFSLGACLYQPLVVIGLSDTRIKFIHVQLPT